MWEYSGYGLVFVCFLWRTKKRDRSISPIAASLCKRLQQPRVGQDKVRIPELSRGLPHEWHPTMISPRVWLAGGCSKVQNWYSNPSTPQENKYPKHRPNHRPNTNPLWENSLNKKLSEKRTVYWEKAAKDRGSLHCLCFSLPSLPVIIYTELLPYGFPMWKLKVLLACISGSDIQILNCRSGRCWPALSLSPHPIPCLHVQITISKSKLPMMEEKKK